MYCYACKGKIASFVNNYISFAALGDEKVCSPAGSIKTESSVPFDGFSPLNNDHEDRQGEEAIQSFSQQLPNMEKAPEVDVPASPSPGANQDQTKE